LSFSSSTEKSTLKTGSTYAPVAAASVSFVPTSHKSASCTKGSETIYIGTLTGTLTLNTGIKSGDVTVTKFSAKGTTPTETVDSGCIPPLGNDCLSSIVATSSSSTTGVHAAVLSGTIFGVTLDDVTVYEKTLLSLPKGASREDAAILDKPTVTWTSSKKTLSISTSSSGEITGSATISGGKPTVTSGPCTFSGKKYTDVLTTAMPATWSSSAGKELVGKMTLMGNLSTPTPSTKAGYTVETD
jgi:hypothetical protein